MKTIIPYVLHRYRARSWTMDNGEEKPEFPGKFYLAEDVEPLLDKLKMAHDFDIRRYQALEKFYLLEMDRLRQQQKEYDDE